MRTFTTGGPEKAYGEDSRNGSIDKILFHIEHGMLYFTGFDVLPRYVVWAPVRLSDGERKDALDGYVRHLELLDTVQCFLHNLIHQSEVLPYNGNGGTL